MTLAEKIAESLFDRFPTLASETSLDVSDLVPIINEELRPIVEALTEVSETCMEDWPDVRQELQHSVNRALALIRGEQP